MAELVAIIEDPGDVRRPPLAREALGSLVEQLRSAQARIKQLEATHLAWHRSNQASRRRATIPGVGVITATALVATIGDGAPFRSGRQLSAWLGLVPRQHSSGGKDRPGRISKRGDGTIRRLLVQAARTVLRWRRHSQLASGYRLREGNDDSMAKQGDRDRPNPRHRPSIELVGLTGCRSLGFHPGQRSTHRSEKAGYMTASATTGLTQFPSCNTRGCTYMLVHHTCSCIVDSGLRFKRFIKA